MATILIVDDSRFQHTMLRQILEPAGYSLHFAGNGQQALEMLDRYPIDGVIADLIMPEMRGTTLLEKIQARAQSLPVVILTADIQEHVRSECLALGAKRVLHKPVRSGELLEALSDIFAETSP